MGIFDNAPVQDVPPKDSLYWKLKASGKPVETRSISATPAPEGRNLLNPYLPGTREFTSRVDSMELPNPLTTPPSQNPLLMGAVGATSPIGGTLKRARPAAEITFQKPHKGPSGAELKGYKWEWLPQELEEDKIIRISDWDASEVNPETGRNIVHKFRIATPDGKESLVSSETAAKVLGYDTKSGGKAVSSALKSDPGFKLVKLQVKRAGLESDLDAAKRAWGDVVKTRSEVEKLPLPEVEFAGPASWSKDGKVIQWKMGDVTVGEMASESTGKGPSQERLRALVSSWREKRFGELTPGVSQIVLSNEMRGLEYKLRQIDKKIKATDDKDVSILNTAYESAKKTK